MAKKQQAGAHKLTWLLIASNVIAFMIVFSAPVNVREGLFDGGSISLATATQVWRWITSMFLHASASHLFFNMLGLYIFGKIVEDHVGPQYFLAIYFIGGILGSLAFMLTSPVSAVGASAAIFGLLGAAMFMRPLQRIHFYVFPLPLTLVAAMFIITESLVAYYQPGFGNVAHVAHLGGLITGSVFAFGHDSKEAMKGILWLGLMAAILIIIFPIIGFVSDIGQLILNAIDFVVGIVLYGLASLLSFLWR